MASRFHRLPLRGLTVFEAAARHGRFTAAADELLMTQAGVSQHIAQLEADLGVDLFVRGHRGVRLTSAGAMFLETVVRGLKTLSDGVASTRRQAGRKTLRVLTDYGFAAWWLMPRLTTLAELLPGVEVQLATTQAELDATGADFDIGIMFGRGNWPGYDTVALFPEEVFPVCAPGYLAGRPTPMAAADIAALRLLHLRGESHGRWYNWSDWFAAHDTPAEFGQEDIAFDNFQLVLQATLLGQGVCIGWKPLIDDLIAGGGLIRLSETPLRSSRGYHLVEHADRPCSANVATLKAWLLEQRPQVATRPRARQPAIARQKSRPSSLSASLSGGLS